MFIIDLVEQPKKGVAYASSEQYARELAAEEARKYGSQLYHKAQSSTQSMLGAIPKRAYFAAEKQPSYNVNDIVVFPSLKKPGHIVPHTVKHVRDGAVYTQGSNNARGDGWIPIEQLHGAVQRWYTW